MNTTLQPKKNKTGSYVAIVCLVVLYAILFVLDNFVTGSSMLMLMTQT